MYGHLPQLWGQFLDRLCALDIETTGLRIPRTNAIETDEIIQLAIINNEHETKFYESFKPELVRNWPEAELLHGIAFRDVQETGTFQGQNESECCIVIEVECVVKHKFECAAKNCNGRGNRISAIK